MDEIISSFIDSVIKQKKLQFLIKEINCSDSLFSEKIIQLDGDKISIINFEIISFYFLIKYKEKFDFEVVAEFEENSNFINRIKDDFLDNGYVQDFQLLEKEIWKTVIIESNSKFKCSFNKYLNSIDLENKPRGINKFLNAYSNELPNLKLKTQDIFENVLILMDITKSDADYNIDLGIVLNGVKEKCKEDYDLGLELLTISLALVGDKEQLLSTIVTGLYENKKIYFYNSVLEELIEKENKLNPIFFGLSKISVIEDEECQLFIKLIKNYDKQNSLSVSISSLAISILKTSNKKYHSYCFSVLIKVIKNENSASYIINNLNLINSSDSKKTDIVINFINQKYFSIDKYIILVSNVFWHLKEFDSFKRIVLTLIETEPFTKFIKHFRSYLSSVDKIKLDNFIIALLTDNQARKRYVGLEIFDRLSTQIPYQFSLEILSLSAIDQYKLWVSLTQEFHDPKKRIVALLPLLHSKSELVKESFLCKLEELSEDYGGYIISIVEENFDIDNPNYSSVTERLKSFIDEFYNVNINLKMPILEFNPYQTHYKYIRRFDELYHKTFNDSMNRGVEENSFLKYLGSNTIMLSKGGGWKLGAKKEISQLGKYGTSLRLPRSYFINPNLYELEKGQEMRIDWTDKEFLNIKNLLENE